MRFLLHTVKQNRSSVRPGVPVVATKSRDWNHKFLEKERNDDTTPPPSSTEIPSSQRRWSQQCSATCGCVLRLEASIDASGIVQSAVYHAKQVVTDAKLVPITTRKGRIMFQRCRCSSLHQLASHIVDYLPSQNSQRLRNLVEFQQTRSSRAFQRSVLQAQKLPSTDTHCFDVAEEALTALLKGYLPKSRQSNTPEEWKYLVEFSSQGTLLEDEQEDWMALTRSRYMWKDEDDRVPFDSSSNVFFNALKMFDWNMEQNELMIKKNERQQRRNLPIDWVSYVDEMHFREEDNSVSA